MRETTPKEIIDRRLDHALERWNGLPLDIRQISVLADVKYETIRSINNMAVRKLRRIGLTQEILEYLTD